MRTHGLKGEVSVAVESGTPLEALLGREVWIVPPPAGPRSGQLRSVRPGPKGVLVFIDGFGSIDAARAIIGSELMVRADELPEDWEAPDAADEDDLVGWNVIDAERGEIGEIVETILTGANDVWVVEGPLGEVLVPVIDSVVSEYDPDAAIVRVTLLPGLVPGEDGIA